MTDEITTELNNLLDTKLKARELVKIENITPPQKGREILFVNNFLDIIIGKFSMDALRSTQKSHGNKHIFEVIDSHSYRTFNEIAIIAYICFSKFFNTETEKRLFVATKENMSKIEKKGEDYFFENEEVTLCIFPKINEKRKQLIVPFDFKKEILKSTEKRRETEEAIVKRHVGGTNITKVTNFTFKDIVEKAKIQKASDLHINFLQTPYHCEYNVMFSVDGDDILQPQFEMTKEQGKSIIDEARREASEYTKGGSFLSDQRHKNQTGLIKYKDLDLDLRSTFYTDGNIDNYGNVTRILYPMSIVAGDIDRDGSLGFGEKFKEAARKAVRKKSGLILITGKVGSGKTMLATQMLASSSPTRKGFSFEDPIEYPLSLKNIVQVQRFDAPLNRGKNEDSVNTNTPLEFLKTMKRLSPSFCSLGEWRKDKEQTEAMLEAANMGTLIYATLHIKTAPSVYNALEEVWEVPKKTSVELLEFVVNMKLTKRLCPQCKEADKSSENIIALQRLLDTEYFDIVDIETINGFVANNGEDAELFIKSEKGCEKCGGKGYRGRVPVYEYFSPNSTFRDWLEEKNRSSNETARKIVSLKLGETRTQSFIRLLKEGIIDTNEIILDEIFQ